VAWEGGGAKPGRPGAECGRPDVRHFRWAAVRSARVAEAQARKHEHRSRSELAVLTPPALPVSRLNRADVQRKHPTESARERCGSGTEDRNQVGSQASVPSAKGRELWFRGFEQARDAWRCLLCFRGLLAARQGGSAWVARIILDAEARAGRADWIPPARRALL
jgi:hypothetical protein